MPAPLLRYLAPWSATASAESRPPWNPLEYDAIGQFYPWRAFAAEQIRRGTIPLWNPYEFCGTPFVANSQSAVLYPGNLLYYLLPTARAAGWTAFLHLVLAASLMWLFLRRLGASDGAGAVAGIAYAFSTWQVAWLELPTFLATSCWLPLGLLLTHRLFEKPLWTRAVGLGFAIGMALLAGHLQIAFYVLLACFLLALALVIAWWKRVGAAVTMKACGLFVSAVLLGGMVASPQVLPSLELSRRSHRNIPVSAQGYQAYTAYAVDAGSLVTLLLPDFFGNPSNPDAPYFGVSRGSIPFNYAEGALYVGVTTLLLAVVALLRARRDRRALWLGGLALLALLMALGTAVDALLYFHVTGFGQSGSPGRALVLWAFALAALAGLGWDRLRTDTAGESARAAVVSVVLVVVFGGLLYVLAARVLGSLRTPDLAQPWIPGLGRQVGLLALTTGLGALVGRRTLRAGLAAGLVGLVAVDLLANGINYNLTAPPSEVYPGTPMLAFLQQNAGHDRIMPVNRGWSLFAQGPRQATLPPNGAMVFRLHDVQGYDSLFPGQYKAFMNRLAGQDASPPEVGNMVFAKDPYSPLVLDAGVRFVVSPEPLALAGARETYIDNLHVYELPGSRRALATTDAGGTASLSWRRDDPDRVALDVNASGPATVRLADQLYPGWRAEVDGHPVGIERDGIFRRVPVPAGPHTVAFTYRPAAFRVGLYLLLVGLGVGGFGAAVGAGRRPG